MITKRPPRYMLVTLKQEQKNRRIFLMTSGRVNLTKMKVQCLLLKDVLDIRYALLQIGNNL